MGVGAGVSGGSKDTSNHTVANSTTNSTTNGTTNGTGTAGSLNVGGTFYDPAVTGYNSGVLGTIGGLGNSYLGPATNANATAGNYLNGQGGALDANQTTANGAYTGSATYQPQQLSLDNPVWAPQVNANHGTPAPTVQAGKFTNADVSAYMSPYLQNVADTTLHNLGRANDMALNNQNAQAAAGGYFGGSRSAVLNAETNKNFGDTAANALSGLFNTGFNNAQGQINADQNRMLTADTGNADRTYAQINNDQNRMLTADTGNADRNIGAQQVNKTAEYNTQLANANLGLQGRQLNIAGANGLSGANNSILSGLQGLSAGGLNYGGLASGAGKGLPVNSNTGSLALGNTANNTANNTTNVSNMAGVSNSNGGESGMSGNVQV